MSKTNSKTLAPPKQATDALRRLGPHVRFTETTACRLIKDWCGCSQDEAKARFDALYQTKKIEKSVGGNTPTYTLVQ